MPTSIQRSELARLSRALQRVILLLALLVNGAVLAATPDALVSGWVNPPAKTKPWIYWYWINGQVSREGITRDLEAMARVGIGQAFIGNIYQENQPMGNVQMLSDEWWDLVRFTTREAGRVGVNIGMFNGPGWSQSGGPWIKPAQAMRYVASSETRVTGPMHFEAKLPVPREPFQDIAVLAFPAPLNDTDTLAAKSPHVVCSPAVADAQKLVDGDLDTAIAIPADAGRGRAPFTIEIELSQPLTARTLEIVPAPQGFAAACELFAEEAGGWNPVRKFRCERGNTTINVGPMPRGPVTVALPAVSAKRFRLVFTGYAGKSGNPAIAEIGLSSAARLESYVEKQLGKMHPTPLPMWDAYLWPTQPEANDPHLAVPAGEVRDLSANLAPDGTLKWDAPPGDWVIVRSGMTPTGAENHPVSGAGKGLEADKMSRAVAQQHFDAYMGEMLRRIPAEERKAFTTVVADSYETGPENWTDGFDALFQAAYHYDPKPWLPVLTGRIVGSADQSERFLWDLRRLVADRVATEYVGGLKEAASAQGLGLWLENYGHWGFPSEFLKYGGASGRIGGEFWVTGILGSIECRAASSAANTYGMPFVSAESFTGGPPFQYSPGMLRSRGDWSFCEGINHVVLHVMIHQPWTDRVPGLNAPWGTEINPHNTWFEQSKAWIDYERRSCWLLQQGWRVADVAYFIGEDAPKMTGVRQPALPAGRDFDYINAEVIETKLEVRDGRLVLPHGTSYRVLVLPQLATMRPALLRKIRDLVQAGATVLGPAPTRSPSLAGYPAGDAEVAQLAAELWGDKPGAAGEHAVGRGRVVWGRTLEELFAQDKLPADLEIHAPANAKLQFTHRSAPEAEIYFITNQDDREQTADFLFRESGRQPELWDAVTGERRDLGNWSVQGNRTALQLAFAARQSWFVVFRRPAQPTGSSQNDFPAPQTVATLSGEWEVRFDPKWGGPASATFAALTDWSKHAEPGIKFYSGHAMYRKTFERPAMNTPNARVWLDLGEVHDVARIRLNGRELATLWTAPWRADVTDALQPGTNTLEVEITNPWNNRLVGDAALPVEQRLTSLSLATVKPDAPLLPAGLLGPVTLQVAP